MVDEKLDLIIKKNEDFKKNTDLIIKKPSTVMVFYIYKFKKHFIDIWEIL